MGWVDVCDDLPQQMPPAFHVPLLTPRSLYVGTDPSRGLGHAQIDYIPSLDVEGGRPLVVLKGNHKMLIGYNGWKLGSENSHFVFYYPQNISPAAATAMHAQEVLTPLPYDVDISCVRRSGSGPKIWTKT